MSPGRPDAEDAADTELQVGSRVGPYALTRIIGRGGMGEVFEARHERIGQRAAVKIMARGRGDGSARRRFLTEARALSRVAHPALVRVFDCGETPAGVPWISMELLAGETLRARLERLAGDGERLPLDRIVRSARQIASALAAIHGAGIVHRDLKPDNVMVVEDEEAAGGERLKLLDFGIAKLLETDAPLTTGGTVLGTAAYMAPEQCVGAGEIDGRADVYALGVLLYEMLAGERPFLGDASSVMRQHLFVEPAPIESRVPDLPPALPALLSSMLAKEPSLRPRGEAVVERLRVLEASFSSEPLPALETCPTDAAVRPPVRSEDGQITLDAVDRFSAPTAPAPREHRSALPAPRRRWIAGALTTALLGIALAFWALGSARSRAAPPALPGMVRLAGGRFRMGSSPEELRAACAVLPGGCAPEEMPQLQREQPPHDVTLSPFQIDADEVTNADYAAFLGAVAEQLDAREDRDEHYPRFVVERVTGLLLVDLHPQSGGVQRTADGRFAARPDREKRPVSQVTWDGASRYCHHVGKRLPTEAEWEFAARGSTGRRFPWSDEPPRCDGVVFGRRDTRGCPDLPAQPESTGTAPQDVTPEGVRGLAGNVSEWVQDQFLVSAYLDCAAGCVDPVAETPGPLADDVRIFRGGSFRGVAWFARATTRSRWKRTEVMEGLGFRCASR